MGHHYVPRYYLGGFANLSGNVWVYEKGTRNVFCSSTRRIANETRFYSEEIEKYLANQIEHPANRVLEKIRAGRSIITSTEKLELSKYIVVMFKRVPKGKERIRDKSPELLNEKVAEIDQLIETLITKHPDKAHLLNRKDEIQEIRNELENNPDFVDDIVRDAWLSVIPSDATPRSTEVLHKMTWQFYVTVGESVFITSDNPAFFFSSIGISNQQSEVSFPISNDICLLASWRKDKADRTYIRAKENFVHQINRRSANNATRHLYHSDKVDWVKKLATKKSHSIRKLIFL